MCGRNTVTLNDTIHAARFVQKAKGYEATVVSGEITFRDGVHTGALPGRLVRGAQR